MIVRNSRVCDLWIGDAWTRQRFLKLFVTMLILAVPGGGLANENSGEAMLPGYYFELNDIVVNLTEGEERVYLTLNIGISAAAQKDVRLLRAGEPDLRESIQRLIREIGREALSKPGGRRNCHQRLQQLVASHLPAGQLKRLFLLDFILR